MYTDQSTRSMSATTYIEMMSHTCAVNIGLFFGLKGRIIPTASACTSGSQGVGYAYEAIKFGQQSLMAAGGAEELCAADSAVFDTLFAASLMAPTSPSLPLPRCKQSWNWHCRMRVCRQMPSAMSMHTAQPPNLATSLKQQLHTLYSDRACLSAH